VTIVGEGPAALRLLSDVLPGAHGVITRLYGGRGLLARLAAFGFTVGAEVEVVRNDGNGPVLVTLRDTSVALGRGEAGKIQVRVRTSGDG